MYTIYIYIYISYTLFTVYLSYLIVHVSTSVAMNPSAPGKAPHAKLLLETSHEVAPGEAARSIARDEKLVSCRFSHSRYMGMCQN